MASTDNPFRALPRVDDLAREVADALDAAGLSVPEAVRVALTQDELSRLRERIKAEGLGAAEVEHHVASGALARACLDACRRETERGVLPAVNATGVVLHTNLGRAPVHPDAALAMAQAASGYCALEVDRHSGKRNERDGRLGELLARATGAEAGIAVNNCAAAAFLTMQTFAGGREAIVSRGELVEIGGSFRVPDVMVRAGATLVEVGTTNRTRAADYERAIGPDTGLLMKVHTSNFRVVGFTEEVDPKDLADLAREHGITSAWDLGSGRFEADGARALDVVGDETVVRDAVASGVDVVMFSGDKLLGAPQAGLIVGRRAAIRALRSNPIYRALRLDKVALAGLETTLGLLASGRGDEIPARSMMHRTRDELRAEARAIADEVNRGGGGLSAEVVDAESQPGSGSAPTVTLPGAAVLLRQEGRSADDLTDALRRGEPPVFARIHDGDVLLDPRALLPARQGLAADRDRLLAALRRLAGRGLDGK